MHFAYPGRKSSNPSNFTPRQNRSSIIHPIRRRVRLRTVLVGSAVVGLLYLIISWLFSPSSTTTSALSSTPPMTKAPSGHPNVVLVTVIDDERGEDYNEAIKKNREVYASKHGYATFFPSVEEYEFGDAPVSWAKTPALRHALTQFPKSPYFFHLDDHTLITNPSISVEEHLTNSARIESLAITDVPVVPPDSVIKTLHGVPGDYVDLLLVQDKEGLNVNSFVLRNGEWARYFLDTWFDPLYRTYNFQKAERHALEHIVQWHGTLLAKLALFPQNVLASYTGKDSKDATENGVYDEGDFVVSFGDCDSPNRNCREEMSPWIKKLHGISIELG